MTMQNLNSLIRKLNRLGGDKAPLVRGIKKATIKVQGDAKLLAPVDTGRLRNSIQAETKEIGGKVVGRIFTSLEYAPYVEFGTGQRGEASPSPPKSPDDLYYRQDWVGMEAQPYMYPAAKQNEKIVPKIVGDEIRKDLRSLRGRR